MEKPEESFNAGAVQASVFMNIRKVNGKPTKIPSISFQKRYLDNGEWKSTTSLGLNDLPKAMLVLLKAYEYLLSKTKDQDVSEEEGFQEA